MEEIEYKLGSKDPVLIAHGTSKLLEAIKKKMEGLTDKDISKIQEYKLLLSKYDNSDPILTMTLCQALIVLVESKMLSITAALSTFTSYLSTANNYVAITASMSQLLILELKSSAVTDNYVCPFSFDPPQHPFLTILHRDKYGWQPILNQMQFLMNHHDQQIMENSPEMLRPVFLYILCSPSYLPNDCKQQVWQLLFTSSNALELQAEILSWTSMNQINVCIDTNYRILDLAKLSMLKEDTEYCTTLLPLLSSLTVRVIEYGLDPRPNFDTLSEMVFYCNDYALNITMMIIAELIAICPAPYLLSLLQTCTVILKKKTYNITILNTLIVALLKWMAFPSIMCSDALTIGKSILNNILLEDQRTNDIEKSESSNLFAIVNQNDSNIQFCIEIISCMHSWTEHNVLFWLKNIAAAPIDIRYKCKLILSAIFLQSSDLHVTQEVCNILIQICRETTNFASHMLCIVLHKLTKSRNHVETMCLLRVLPELTIVRENTPIIIHNLDRLFNCDKPLKYFAIELYLKVVQKDARCYRFLSTALIQLMKTDESWYATATCARAMNSICETCPEHCEEMVPLLSQILNRCTDANGSTACALALKSISALCKSAAIGICSTWKVIAPKMKKEKRTIVLESLCDMLGDIPFYPSQQGNDYDELIFDVLSVLWKFVLSNDIKIGECALKALHSYNAEQIPLKTLPVEFKCNLIIPKAYTKLKTNIPVEPDNLPYIPGICWIQMLEKINEELISAAGDLLISFIKTEVNTFHSNIYVWPQGEPTNFKYLSEKSVIRAVGEYIRQNEANHDNERVIVECLRIFAYKYPKPLPNVQWNFLHKTDKICSKSKEYSISIACHHAAISLSARTYIENYLLAYTDKDVSSSMVENKEYLLLYLHLEDLCQTLQQQNLRLFLEGTSNHILGRTILENEESITLFKHIMLSFTKTLQNRDIHDINRSLLSDMLVKLLDKIDLTCEHFKPYITALLELPLKHVERITSPSVWWEVTSDKLKNAITVRSEMILINDAPLNSFNEIIDAATSTPDTHPYLLQCIQRITTKMRFEKSSTTWVLDFMNHIQGIITETSGKDMNKTIFYCDVLMIAVICLSGVDCLLLNKTSLIDSQDILARLFPQAITIVADRQLWKNIFPQVMDSLNYLRISTLPESYKLCFHNALIAAKHEPHYGSAWSKYLSVKMPMHL